jgi:hypothetical protein
MEGEPPIVPPTAAETAVASMSFTAIDFNFDAVADVFTSLDEDRVSERGAWNALSGECNLTAGVSAFSYATTTTFGESFYIEIPENFTFSEWTASDIFRGIKDGLSLTAGGGDKGKPF